MSASTVAASGSLSVCLAHAITYLTRSLIVRYSATTIVKLQLALEANLTAQFAPSWLPSEPLRGSGRRCLTLSPTSLPPRTIFIACQSAGVEWSQWIALLGGVEFDLFIDPGCVSARFGNWDSGKAKCFTIWSEEAGAKEQERKPLNVRAKLSSKTLAQQLLENDEDEDEQLFVMIADEVRHPTWITPILTQFPDVPAPPRSLNSSPISVMSAISAHSRSSSSSSSSFSSGSDRSMNSYSTATTASRSSTSPSDELSAYKISRREKARQARVYVDPSKKEVTNYDGGKTTVMTGGVMLGGVPQPRPTISTKTKTTSASSNWRSLRA